MKISLVLLTLNEVDGSTAIFESLPLAAVDEVLVVDGGSTDGTREFFRAKNVRVVDQDRRGRGEAMRVAAAVAQGDALIFFSPDGNEDPGDIGRFRPLLEAGNDLVIGSRMMRGAYNEEDAQFFRWRKWANKTFTHIAHLFWGERGAKVTDTINGFRAIRKDAFERLGLDSTGYTIEFQMTVRSLKAKLNIAEFPTTEGQRIGGEGYAKSLPTGWAMLKTLVAEMRRK